jgi:hypothetical protein
MSGDSGNDDSLYPIAVLIDELRNEDVQVRVNQKQKFPAQKFQKIFDIKILSIFSTKIVEVKFYQEIVYHCSGIGS